MTRPPLPDFMRRGERTPLLAWVLLLAGACVLALALGDLVDLHSDMDETDAGIEALELRTKARPPAGSTADVARRAAEKQGASPLPLEAARALRRTEQSLQRPWDRALIALEQATVPGVRWLELDVSGEPARLRAEGMAPNVDAALSVVDGLSDGTVWTEVVLTRLQTDESPAGSNGEVQRFEITALSRVDTASPSATAGQEAAP